MSKTNEELLLYYKRSNKERRAKIVTKAGFANEADYLKSLLHDDAPSSPAAAKLFKKNDLSPVVEEDAGMLDQVIAFDTTGSMSSYIDAVKQHVQELIPKLFSENKNLRIKIIAFGDYCDMATKTTFGRAYQESTLTDNQNELIKFVQNAQNTGGDDSDEFYELVLHKVIKETPWRYGSRRAMLLIGDCEPHPVGYTYGDRVIKNQIDWREEAKKAAAIDLQIDTLSCGTRAVKAFYQPLSKMTNGVNIPFSSSSKTQHAVYAATSVRGSSGSKMAFTRGFDAAMDSGDEELIGTYKSLSKKL